jgi:hypothetical protein
LAIATRDQQNGFFKPCESRDAVELLQLDLKFISCTGAGADGVRGDLTAVWTHLLSQIKQIKESAWATLAKKKIVYAHLKLSGCTFFVERSWSEKCNSVG